MIIRRYYPQGFKGKTYSDEYLEKLQQQGVDVDIVDTAKEELILTKEEQEALYEQTCDMILNDTRWVLDNLEHLCEYKVNWQDYRTLAAKEKRKIDAKNRKLYK